jgi:glycosyltransferase involved in cell wall biosynthesis
MMRNFEHSIKWFTPPGLNSLSGMTLHAAQLRTALMSHGVNLEFVTVPPLADANHAATWTRTLADQLVKRPKQSGVHIDLNGLGGRSVFSACLQSRTHSSISFHATHRYTDRPAPGILQLELEWLARGHAVVALNPGDADLLLGAGARNVAIIPHGVDPTRFTPSLRSAELRASWGASAETPVLLWCGRLSPEKDPGTFIVAAQTLLQRRPDAQVVVIGEGPLRDQVRAALPHARMLGMLQGEDLPRAMASADLLAFTSPVDTWGLVVGEAMACGIPVVAYDRAAAGEMIRTGIDGVTSPTGDRGQLIAAIVDLAADQQRCRVLGASARERFALWSWERVAQRWLTLWQRCGVLPAKAAT